VPATWTPRPTPTPQAAATAVTGDTGDRELIAYGAVALAAIIVLVWLRLRQGSDMDRGGTKS